MGKKVDRESLVGIKIDMLMPLKYLGNNNYLCQCDCGNKIIKSYTYLKYCKATQKSCGCFSSNATRKFNTETKHKTFDNKYKIENHILYIQTEKKNQIYEFIFDEDMLEWFKKINCRLNVDSRGYCFISLPYNNKYNIAMCRQLFLHNLILCGFEYYLPKDNNILVDHINTKIYDNRKSNLRITNCNGNAKNANIRKDNSSGIKGINIIFFHKKTIHLCARVQSNNKRVKKIFDFNEIGLKNAINWIYNYRESQHKEFSNHGNVNYMHMTEKEIKKDMFDKFIENMSDKYIKIFYKQKES